MVGLSFTANLSASCDGRCASAAQQVERARTIPDVVRAADITGPRWLRSVTRRAEAVLKQQAERKAQALLETQIKELDALEGDARALRLPQLRREWETLRGHFPRLAVMARRVRWPGRPGTRARAPIQDAPKENVSPEFRGDIAINQAALSRA